MIELKYFERADFKQLMDWIDSPKLLLQWGGNQFDYPLTESQLEKYIENANHPEADIFVYKAIRKETGEAIGHISLGKIDRKHKSARIGKVLVGKKNLRGQGIGQRMVQEVLKIAFDQLHLHRVSLGVFDFNTTAMACYEKVGFQKEGLARYCSKFGDKYWSLWEMSILENEWLERQQS